MSDSILERFMNGDLNMNEARSEITRMVTEEPASAWGTALNLAGEDHFSRDRESRVYDRNQGSAQLSPTFDPIRDELAYQISNGSFHGPQAVELISSEPLKTEPVLDVQAENPATPMPSYNDYTFNRGGGNNLW